VRLGESSGVAYGKVRNDPSKVTVSTMRGDVCRALPSITWFIVHPQGMMMTIHLNMLKGSREAAYACGGARH
jgi:hypothetical protein